jgi:hypothetical protein
LEEVKQFPARAVLHPEVKFSFILEGALDFDNEGMSAVDLDVLKRIKKSYKDLALCGYALDCFGPLDAIFFDDFHRHDVLGIFSSD